MDSPRTITLTTDFGLRDAYVGVMKGVILGIAGHRPIVDISHQVAPQNVSQAGFLLRTAYRYFPVDAIHLAVVDPGVGTGRKPIAVATPWGVFVGPDNGLFSQVLADQGLLSPDSELAAGATAVVLSSPPYRLLSPSQTFHGRDIFAPAAAHLARGVPLREFGPPLSRLVTLPHAAPIDEADRIVGSIVHIDGFGNAISNISRDILPENATVEIGGRLIGPIRSSYQDDDVLALVGSSGEVEVAIRNGSAAAVLGIGVGDLIVVRSEC